jgi:predicted DCC family thiol-disulfide oxidoreductase YuxK
VGVPARLYFATSCLECSQLARWLARRQPLGLELQAAEEAPWKLVRLTYMAADGRREAGMAALGRALEHVNLAWAFAGWCLRLPGILQSIQLLADAVGAGPRDLPSPRSAT